jgi:rod shape determining protein RodA
LNSLARNILLLKKMSWLMAIAVVSLIVIGIFFIYSSCYVSEDQMGGRFLYKKQMVWAIAGMLCFAICATLNYQEWGKVAWLTYATGIFLLVVVLLVGRRTYGATRWLDLFGIGVQPSEIAKVATILVLARALSRPAIDFVSLQSIGMLLGIVALPFLLIVVEPDYGTALIFLPTLFVMMLVGGVPIRIMMSFVLVGAALVGIMLGVLFLPERLGANKATQEKVMHMAGMSNYHKNRIKVFVGMDVDPLGPGWNKMQSELAVGSGGAWGKGFRKGTQNILGFLPPSIAPTDFIYSVIAEEKGFLGSVVVLLLFGVVITLGMLAGLRARDKFGRLLCVGIVTMIFCHVFINIAMTVGLMPIIGVPLPLLSYGGSFMIVTMSVLGITQSVHIRSQSMVEDFS